MPPLTIKIQALEVSEMYVRLYGIAQFSFLCRLNECSWRHIAIQILYVRSSVRASVRPLKFRLTFFKLLLFEQVCFNYNQTWIIGALWEPSHYDALGGHMTRSKVIWGQIVIVISAHLTFFKLLLFEQVRFNYNQTWYIGALWEPSHYDALRGHMTRSKVIGGQIVIVISVNLFQIAPVRTGLLQLQPNLVHRCIMGTFSLWRSSRSHDKVKGHWRSNC